MTLVNLFKYYLVIILVALTFASCSATINNNAEDLENNKKIVSIAYSLTYGCPGYFIHPDVYRPPNEPYLIKSDKGRVAWTPSGIMGASPTGYFLENKDDFIRRLNKASVIAQSSYSQYQQIQGAGFPGVENNDGSQFPDRLYQAGFVCYAYVTRAIRDAGNTITNPASVNELVDQLAKVNEINENMVKTGDIVVYDFDNDGDWDHCGVINRIEGSNPEDWTVFSSIGLVELFEYGATETRLGVFQTPSNGGYFTWWDTTHTLMYEVYTNRAL